MGLSCYADMRDTTEIDSIKEYKEYFEEYAERLYENFHPEKRFFFGQGNFFYFFINRDGNIEHLETFFKDNRFSRYGKKVILNTPAYPFPEEIKDDKIFVYMDMTYFKENMYEVYLCGRRDLYRSIFWKQHYEKPTINIVDISIERNRIKLHKDEK